MIKKIVMLVKKVIISCVILYSFNLIIAPLSINIPINYYTIGILTLLGFPGLFSLVIVLLIAI